MKSSVFISYSRREAPFVSFLFKKLKDCEYEVWLDFQHLVPAQKWQEQITQAIQEAQVFLLVVSTESIKSENVRYEWRRAVELKKRIVLVIFEAVELPLELKDCEWIDFRTSFKQGVRNLVLQLESPSIPETPPPQTGFKTSRTVWLAFSVSLLLSLLSLLVFWTVYIPYHLVPLPYRILKRNFKFFEVQGVLLALPLALFLSLLFIVELFPTTEVSYVESILGLIFLSCFFIIPLMLILLRLPNMRRWGKPMASVPIFAHPYRPPKAIEVRSMKVMLDHAVEDTRYANAIIHQLKRYHQIVTDESAAEAIIVLISNFKKSTAYNPEERIIYPVLLQDIKGFERYIDPQLSQIQWVDFRRGLRNLKYFCMLLPNPTKMLNALGIVPMGRQVVLPPIIQTLVYFLTSLLGLTIGGSGLTVFTLGIILDSSSEVVAIAFTLLTMGASVYLVVLARRSLLSRQGQLATFRNLTIGLTCLVCLWLGQMIIGILIWQDLEELSLGSKLDNIASNAQILLPLLYLVGLAICGIMCLWYWKDLSRWIPCQDKRNPS